MTKIEIRITVKEHTTDVQVISYKEYDPKTLCYRYSEEHYEQWNTTNNSVEKILAMYSHLKASTIIIKQ
jgi:hypothetical protein